MPVIELEGLAMIEVSDEELEASAGVKFTIGTYGTGACGGSTNEGFGCQ
jgi:hypothetical protein